MNVDLIMFGVCGLCFYLVFTVQNPSTLGKFCHIIADLTGKDAESIRSIMGYWTKFQCEELQYVPGELYIRKRPKTVKISDDVEMEVKEEEEEEDQEAEEEEQ